MSPKACALLIVEIAKEDSVYDGSNAIDEVVYILAWYVWDLLDQEAPEWTEALGKEIDSLRKGITSKGCHERFAAYSEAKINTKGGGPGWHIARTFQSYVLGMTPVDVTETMEVSVRLSGLMQCVQKAILADLD